MSHCFASAFSLALAVGGSMAAEPAIERLPGKGSYVVVVSRATFEDAQWRPVVDALRDKHEAAVLIHRGPVAEVRAALAEVFPRYACVVARPEEAGRDFVVAVHRMTRALDTDPYTDVLWGILTGYDAADALRIVQHKERLTVRRAAAGTAIDLGVFDEGRWFSEGEKGAMWEKLAGGTPERKKCPDDSTAALVETLNAFKPDLFLTSGHATPRDWQIGYSYKNGQFRCKDGQLFGLDLQGKAHPIQSPNPKVYLPVGNCLMGLIPDRNCMALAFLHTGGVHQMIGYVVSTWHGYGGWGVRDLFIGQPGRYTLSEAFYANSQALVHQLESRFPKTARVNFDRFDIETDRRLLGRLAAQHGLRDRDEMGLLWDRDTVAFYGDPAWEARLAPRPLAWDQKLTEKGGVYTFELVANQECAPSRPAVVLFPHRVGDVQVIEGADHRPVITDNFLLLPLPAKLEKGKTLRVVFNAAAIMGAGRR
ncbi:MAG TPA: hypothetical protein VNE39_14250 [Planctomycetota bacterium]|nr:hypothetical protein [Planctomycetota bacterium]